MHILMVLLMILSSFFRIIIPQIEKSNIVLNEHMEATPFVLNDHMYYLLTDREATTDRSQLTIMDFDTNKPVSHFGKDLGLASAAVIDGKLYVVGTKSWTQDNNSMYLLQSTDLIHFTDPVLIKSAGDKKRIFNTSITQNTDTKEVIIVFETTEPGNVAFSERFIKSSDMVHWEETGEIFGKDTYNACPTLRYIDETYYMWNLVTKKEGNADIYYTQIERSKDLINWEISPIPFLYPKTDEGINNSDVDLAEFHGKTYVFYANSDQKTYSRLTYGTFNGKLEDLSEGFFE